MLPYHNNKPEFVIVVEDTMKRFQRKVATTTASRPRPQRTSTKPNQQRHESVDSSALHRALANPRQAKPADLLALQSVYGNRAVQRLLDEAHGSLAGSHPLDGSNRQIPNVVRRKMELAFGADFSGVRIHQEAAPAMSGALAYTAGSDIHFAPGRYNPSSESGQSLLAHELAHVVQQRAGSGAQSANLTGFVQNKGLEAEADTAGQRAAQGQPVRVKGASTGAQGKMPKEDTAGPEKQEEKEPTRETPKEFKFRTILNQQARTYFQSFKTRALREAREKGVPEAAVSKQVQELERYIDDLSETLSKALSLWSQTMMVEGVTINGPTAVFKPGNVKGLPLDALILVSDPPMNTPKQAGYTRTFAEGLAENWELWHMGINASLPLYPKFASWPGPQAPPMPNLPMLIQFLPSAGDKMMEQNQLMAAIANGSQGDPVAAGIYNAMTHAVVDIFKLWKQTHLIRMLMGQGPVPTFAPPVVPAGPVQNGTATGVGVFKL
jgi:hypothetical protein